MIRIGHSDFEKPNENLIELVIDYIDSQKKRMYINERRLGIAVEVPKEIQVIYCLCLFSVSLDQGNYSDRTLSIPKMEYNISFFWKYKALLVKGMNSLNLKSEAKEMDYYFTGPKISKKHETALEALFWNADFKMSFDPILIRFLVSNKSGLLNFQEL